MWRKKRPRVTAILTEAAAEGDRSENAEYIYRKKQLREMDSRIRHLRKRLDLMKVVEGIPSDTSRIFFGAWVQLEDDDGNEYRYRIVGPDEFDYENNLISMDAPLGKGLMGKGIDDEVTVETPKGVINYCIVNVSYGEVE